MNFFRYIFWAPKLVYRSLKCSGYGPAMMEEISHETKPHLTYLFMM